MRDTCGIIYYRLTILSQEAQGCFLAIQILTPPCHIAELRITVRPGVVAYTCNPSALGCQAMTIT